MNRQDKILTALLLLNFLVIGTYSTAIPVPLENQNIYLSLYDNNASFNLTDDNKVQDTINTDKSTDSSQTSTDNQQNTGSNSNSQNDKYNQPEPDPEPYNPGNSTGGHG